MCKAEGMAITVWGAMGSGKFKNEEQRKDSGGRAVVNDRSFSQPEEVQKVFRVLEARSKRGFGYEHCTSLCHAQGKCDRQVLLKEGD
jgi:hypothetical protein